MANISVTCAILLLLCSISTHCFVVKGRYHNRAHTDLQPAQKCSGNKYNLHVPSGKKFFWSGFGVQDSDKAAAEIAQYVSKKTGEKCWTLEMILELPENRHIETCQWTVPVDPACEQFWKDISCEYATKAHGKDFESFKKKKLSAWNNSSLRRYTIYSRSEC